MKEVLDWLLHIAIAIVIGLVVVNFVVQRTIVDKYSMEPTLFKGDNLWVEKISPRLGRIKTGDIVTLYVPELLPDGEEIIIKRVIGVENDRIELKDGRVYVNGKELKEDYVMGAYTEGKNLGYDSLVVPKGEIYVLGDNRMNSLDSRTIGTISLKRVTGKAIFRFYPFHRIGFIK